MQERGFLASFSRYWVTERERTCYFRIQGSHWWLKWTRSFSSKTDANYFLRTFKKLHFFLFQINLAIEYRNFFTANLNVNHPPSSLLWLAWFWGGYMGGGETADSPWWKMKNLSKFICRYIGFSLESMFMCVKSRVTIILFRKIGTGPSVPLDSMWK